MAVQVNVSINFTAADKADAESKIGGWKLHEGCTVFVSIQDTMPPQQTDAQGKVQSVPQPEPTGRDALTGEGTEPPPE